MTLWQNFQKVAVLEKPMASLWAESTEHLEVHSLTHRTARREHILAETMTDKYA